MGKDEAKKTMRFWIITGIVAMTAFQIPMLLKKGKPQADKQMEKQQERHPGWMMFLIAIGLLGLILWLFDYFI
jgi:hypothetical protein